MPGNVVGNLHQGRWLWLFERMAPLGRKSIVIAWKNLAEPLKRALLALIDSAGAGS